MIAALINSNGNRTFPLLAISTISAKTIGKTQSTKNPRTLAITFAALISVLRRLSLLAKMNLSSLDSFFLTLIAIHTNIIDYNMIVIAHTFHVPL